MKNNIDRETSTKLRIPFKLIILGGSTLMLLLVYVRTLANYNPMLNGVITFSMVRSQKLLSISENIDNRTNNTTKSSTTREYSDKLTVVTAYFNLGSFPKGSHSNLFTNGLYRQWMTVFASIDNPLIVFLDNDDDLAYFASIRSGLPQNLTKIIKLAKNETWAFRLESKIAEIYKQPGYPKHLPNTVVPSYSAAMHAKYEVMQIAIKKNPFRTKYFCWLDIGLFRSLTSSQSLANKTYLSSPKFRLHLPPGFSSESVAYSQVLRRNPTLKPRDIVYGNEVWLCGCYFVGQSDVLYRWTEEYQNATIAMLSYNLMSTDQQVIYSLFNTMNPKTKIQTYVADGRFNVWFHLGYLSRENS